MGHLVCKFGEKNEEDEEKNETIRILRNIKREKWKRDRNIHNMKKAIEAILDINLKLQTEIIKLKN